MLNSATYTRQDLQPLLMGLSNDDKIWVIRLLAQSMCGDDVVLDDSHKIGGQSVANASANSGRWRSRPLSDQVKSMSRRVVSLDNYEEFLLRENPIVEGIRILTPVDFLDKWA